MAYTITAVTPANGSTISPYPVINVSWAIDSTSDNALRVRIQATNGSQTFYSEDWVKIYSDFSNSSAIWYMSGLSLPDGTWTMTINLYTGVYNPNDLLQGGATTLRDTTTRTYTVASTVSATQVEPASGTWVRANYSDPAQPTLHQQLFTWNMNTNGVSDYQSSYTIEVRRNDTQASVGTFTPAAGQGGNSGVVVGIANTFKDILLEWRVRVTNRYGTVSPYTGWRTFGFATPPVTTITTPTANQALTSGVINIVASATTSGGRTITKTEASIWQGTTPIWSKTLTNTLTSGQSQTINDGSFILPQSGGIPYTLKVKHTDSLNVVSAEVARDFTVTYTAPTAANAPTVSAANYDSDGYITITWTNTGVDASFYAWVVERRERPLDPYTQAQIGSFGNWNEVGRVYVNGTSFTYQDFSAPANSYLEYRIKQVAIRDSYQVISSTANAGTGVSAITNAYWLINLTPSTTGTTAVTTVAGTALKMWNVTGDQYKIERVRNVYNLIGRGRYVERGDKLGVDGTLNAQIRDSGTTNARTKRLDLQSFQDLNSKFQLRNPFGDTITVSIGDIDVTRIPGTGKSEFVDITVPYTEVS